MKNPNARFQFHSVKTLKSRFFSVCSNPTFTAVTEKARTNLYTTRRGVRGAAANIRVELGVIQTAVDAIDWATSRLPDIIAKLQDTLTEEQRIRLTKIHNMATAAQN